MENEVAPPDHSVNGRWVAQVTAHDFYLAAAERCLNVLHAPTRKIVQHPDVADAGFEQLVTDVAAD